MTRTADPVDLLEEFRLRRWARENYCYAEARQPSWHAIICDEMQRRDAEQLAALDVMVLDDESLADPTDSTILSDLVLESAPSRAAAALKLPLPLGPIVPLAPDLPGLHGPHELTPPHTRIAEPAETLELHFA